MSERHGAFSLEIRVEGSSIFEEEVEDAVLVW